MKLLINLCGHDGIISHYAGVGTIVRRYIEVLTILLKQKNIDYHLNLFTLEFNEDSMGYNRELWDFHKNLENSSLYIVPNGTNGETSFGNVKNWTLASQNVARIINEIDFNQYDYVVTLCNDTPFACLPSMIKDEKNSIKAWIPHSTGKIYNVDSSISEKDQLHKEHIDWEQAAVDYINQDSNTYLISTGVYIHDHLIKEYQLKKEKNINIINGEILSRENSYDETDTMKNILEDLNQYDSILMAFGRAEKYKNLEQAMVLGNSLKVKPIIITQQYFDGQPIIEDYKKKAEETSSLLYVDPPFFLPQYIVKYFSKPMIMLIPSEREIFGLIINEIRRFKKDNVLIVANDRGGLHEQIEDLEDGILVDLNDIESSTQKILKHFNEEDMIRFNKNAQKRLENDYNLIQNFDYFFRKILGDDYE